MIKADMVSVGLIVPEVTVAARKAPEKVKKSVAGMATKTQPPVKKTSPKVATKKQPASQKKQAVVTVPVRP